MAALIAEQKTRFRTLKIWKEFRQHLIEVRGPSCECCGTTYSGKRKKQLQIHHLYPSQYELLEEFRFKILCSRCHDAVETINIKLKSKNQTLIRRDLFLALYGEFLPREEPLRSKYNLEQFEKDQN